MMNTASGMENHLERASRQNAAGAVLPVLGRGGGRRSPVSSSLAHFTDRSRADLGWIAVYLALADIGHMVIVYGLQ